MRLLGDIEINVYHSDDGEINLVVTLFIFSINKPKIISPLSHQGMLTCLKDVADIITPDPLTLHAVFS